MRRAASGEGSHLGMRACAEGSSLVDADVKDGMLGVGTAAYTRWTGFCFSYEKEGSVLELALAAQGELGGWPGLPGQGRDTKLGTEQTIARWRYLKAQVTER